MLACIVTVKGTLEQNYSNKRVHHNLHSKHHKFISKQYFFSFLINKINVISVTYGKKKTHNSIAAILKVNEFQVFRNRLRTLDFLRKCNLFR